MDVWQEKNNKILKKKKWKEETLVNMRHDTLASLICLRKR